MLSSVRRGAALVAVPALALAALATTPGSASAAGTDLNPGAAAAGWLEMQTPDYGPFAIGNTIDQALALGVIGGHESTVHSIGVGVADHLSDYTDYAYCTDPNFVEVPPCETSDLIEGTSAGAVAKALVGLQAAGVDNGDVVTQLAGLVRNAGDDLAGRAISPETTNGEPSANGYTNVLGQSFAVRGLTAAGSSEAATAAAYLGGLQCADGSFKEDLPDEGATQDCAGAPSWSSTSVDATALAVIALDAVDSGAADAVVTKATTWLRSVQQSTGGFTSDGAAGTANANSTGLATQALGLTGSTPAAAKGAIWVRQHQVHFQDACGPFQAGVSGAVAFDDADRAATQATGLPTAKSLRATVQAAPALLWAPAGNGANVRFSAEYVKAGGTKSVDVIGADPGEQLCAVAGGRKMVSWADASGKASFKVAISTKTATTRVTVYSVEAKAGVATIRALGAKKLPISLKAKIKKGKVQKVTVRGLAAGESVKVKLLGKTKRGQANKKGVFTASAKATGKPRKVKVTVTGEFGNRSGTKTFKVVR